MSKRIVREKFYSMVQRHARGLKLVLVPFEKTEIPVRVFHLRIKTNCLAVFAGCFFVFPKTDQHNGTKITDARIFRVVALCFGEFRESVLYAIFLKCRKAFLKGIFLTQLSGRRPANRTVK